jgi:hypothetical protein
MSFVVLQSSQQIIIGDSTTESLCCLETCQQKIIKIKAYNWNGLKLMVYIATTKAAISSALGVHYAQESLNSGKGKYISAL